MTTPRATAAAIVAGFVATLLVGCTREDPLDPPRVHFGDDVCEVCHMIVSDERFAAALSVTDANGRVSKPVFDDVGCLFEYEAAHPSRTPIARHVRHAVSGEWLDANAAVFVHSAQIHTPMAFGLAAVANNAEAVSLRRDRGGEVVSLMEARRRVLAGEAVLTAPPTGAASRPDASDNDASATITLDDGRSLRLVMRSPRTLTPGIQPFEVEASVRAAGGGPWRPAESLRIEIRPFMPTMNHGSPRNEHPTHVGAGRYRGVTNLIMAGPWEVRVTVFEGEQEIARHAFELEAKR